MVTLPAPRPFTDLKRTFPAVAHVRLDAVAQIIDSMNRDYHDTRGMPTMSLAAHLRECGLAEPEARLIRDHLHTVEATGAELIALGLSAAGQAAFDGYGDTRRPFAERRILFLYGIEISGRTLLFHAAASRVVELGDDAVYAL